MFLSLAIVLVTCVIPTILIVMLGDRALTPRQRSRMALDALRHSVPMPCGTCGTSEPRCDCNPWTRHGIDTNTMDSPD